jgi:hypothetical protein
MVHVYADALARMKAVLEELDRANAPGDVGAHLDLAICRLEEFLTREIDSVTSVTGVAAE